MLNPIEEGHEASNPSTKEMPMTLLTKNHKAWKDYYTTGLICLTVAFLFADQNLLAPNLTRIAREFGFSDQQRDDKLGGQIAFGFFILGGPVALLAGALADTCNRCVLFSFIVLFGEAACFATYFTRTFEQLFYCRVLTGISIGGASPMIFSLLADIYSENSRIYVSTLIGIAMSIGVGFGQLLAGIIGDTMDDWRLPFLLVATPAMGLALLILLTVKEPRRGEKERAFTAQAEHGGIEAADTPSYSERIDCDKLFLLLSTPSVVVIYLQGIPGCIPWGMLYSYLNDYLALEVGSVLVATAVLVSFGLGGMIGQLLGGYLGQQLFLYDRRLQCLLMGITTAASVVPLMLLINVRMSAASMMMLSAFTGVLISVNSPNVRSVLQDVCYPETRGTAFAFFNLTDDIGKGGGPVLVAMLIRDFKGHRRPAFNIAVLFWIVCGAMLCALAWTILEDENNVQLHVERSLVEAAARRLASGHEAGGGAWNPIHDSLETGGRSAGSTGNKPPSDATSANEENKSGGATVAQTPYQAVGMSSSSIRTY